MLSSPPSILRITYCYASTDEKLVERFEKHLSPLKRHSIIADWFAYKINKNDAFDVLRISFMSDLNLLLLSPDLMAYASEGFDQYIEWTQGSLLPPPLPSLSFFVQLCGM
jgi:hypothetical protein